MHRPTSVKVYRSSNTHTQPLDYHPSQLVGHVSSRKSAVQLDFQLRFSLDSSPIFNIRRRKCWSETRLASLWGCIRPDRPADREAAAATERSAVAASRTKSGRLDRRVRQQLCRPLASDRHSRAIESSLRKGSTCSPKDRRLPFPSGGFTNEAICPSASSTRVASIDSDGRYKFDWLTFIKTKTEES